MRRSVAVVGCLIVAFSIIATSSYSRGAELTAAEQKMLRDAQAYLKQLQTNLKLAQDAAAGAKPAPSKLQLAKVRLGNCNDAVAQIKARLEKLPAGDANVAALQGELDKATAAIDAVVAKLSGGSAAAPAGASGGVKLDYRQEQALKDANFFIRDVTGKATGVAEFIEKNKGVQDQNTIDYAMVQRAVATIDDARKKAKSAADRLAELPADGAGVQSAADELKQATASLDGSEKFIAPLNEKLAKLVDPSTYPDLAADMTRLDELSQTFGRSELFQTDRPQATLLVKQLPAARDEMARIARKYAALMQQESPARKQLEGRGNNLIAKFKEFDAICVEQKSSLPQQIDADLKQINDMADTATKEQKPAFFTDGIPQHVVYAEEKITLYEALDAPAAQPMREKLGALLQLLKEREKSLAESIIAANALPPDRYKGPDKDDLKTRAIAAWKEIEPSAEVLVVRFPSENWKRETFLRIRTGTWSKEDYSKLQAQLIVKQDGKLAVIRPINLTKDHMASDQIGASSFYGKDDALAPQAFLLIEKVK